MGNGYHRRTAEEIKRDMAKVQKYKDAGFSERESCRKAGVNYSSYRFWVMKIRAGIEPEDRELTKEQVREIAREIAPSAPVAVNGQKTAVLTGSVEKIDAIIQIAKTMGVKVSVAELRDVT